MKADAISSGTVERSIEKQEFSPVYLFYGEEDFLIEEMLQRLIESAVDEATRSFNLDIVYGSDVDTTHIAALAASFPMMAERRVVVVKEFDKVSNKDQLLSYIDRPSITTSLVLIAAKPDFRVKFYKTLRDKAVTVESKPLYESEIPPWIYKRVERFGKTISLEACKLMQNYISRSLREIQNEIDKLFIYVGEKNTIEVEDVNAIVGMSRQFNIYELQNALGAKNISRVLEIMEHMLDAGEQPTGIIVMLTRYFQKLWMIQDCVIRKMSREATAAALKISPKQMYFLDNEIQVAKRFTPVEAERSFSLLREADERLKSSNGDPKLVMTLLLYHIVKDETVEVAA